LVVGAPGDDGGNGRIYIFHAGALGTGTRLASTADQQISTSTGAPGWFASAALGSSLAAADFDGDGTRDLVASAPAGGGQGGVVVIYGAPAGDVVVSDVDQSGLGGADVDLIADPGATPGRSFGFYL